MKLDNLASGLQKEKSDFNKANKLQNKTTNESRILIKEYDLKLQDLYDKANQQHRFYEQQNKFVKVGKRVFELIGKHLSDESNKDFKNLPQEAQKNINTIEKEINHYDELLKENSDLKDKWQRALADYQNLERRTQVEILQRVSEKTNDLLLNFINIYEDFLRAEKSLSNEKIDTTGIIAVIKNMENILAENNIKPIDAVGEIFDPQIHEAVSMIVDDTLDEGTITQEVSKGYISGKAILKPSKVIVSKK